MIKIIGYELGSESLSNTGHFAFNASVHMGELKFIYKDFTLFLSLFLKSHIFRLITKRYTE